MSTSIVETRHVEQVGGDAHTLKTSLARKWAWRVALVGPAFITLMMLWAPQNTHPMFTASGLVSLALISAAAYVDFWWYKIPNWATYSAALWGLLINAFSDAVGQGAIATRLGAVGISDSILGCATLFVGMLVMFSFTGGGAGDVKLAAALGALLGLVGAANAILYSFIFAGLMAFAHGLCKYGPAQSFELLWRTVGSFLFRQWVYPPTSEQKAIFSQKMPLGPSFALGTLTVMLNPQSSSFFLSGQ